MVLRALDRDVRIRTVNARLVADVAPAAVTKSTTPDGNTDTGVTLAHFEVTSLFTIPKGEERRVPLRYRLKWETPVSEVRGLPLAGMRIGLYTEVDADGIADRTDVDTVRIETTPLHETLLDAFAAAGYTCHSAWVDPEYLPRTERQILYSRQGFHLAATAADRPRDLELYVHSNAVGAEIYLRRAALSEKDWWGKPRPSGTSPPTTRSATKTSRPRLGSGSTTSPHCPIPPSMTASESTTTWTAPDGGAIPKRHESSRLPARTAAGTTSAGPASHPRRSSGRSPG